MGYIDPRVYDAIYEKMKDYGKEARRVTELVDRYTSQDCHAGAMTLLDVACGTGLHLFHFQLWFKAVEGLDLSEEQLAAARQRLPNVPLHKGNMLSFVVDDWCADLEAPEPTFDVITCLFSAIGHMQDEQQLRLAIRNMAEHLNPGGVLIIEPWLVPSAFMPGHISLETSDPTRSDFQVARMTSSSREGRITTLHMEFLVGEPDGIRHYTEIHELALFTQVEYLRAFTKAGLRVVFEEKGVSQRPDGTSRGVYVGVKDA